MLKQFVRDGGDRKLLAWFQLPKKLFDRASRKCRDGDAACLGDGACCDLITAIVGAILRSAPLRPENPREPRVRRGPGKDRGPPIHRTPQPGRAGWVGRERGGAGKGARVRGEQRG